MKEEKNWPQLQFKSFSIIIKHFSMSKVVWWLLKIEKLKLQLGFFWVIIKKLSMLKGVQLWSKKSNAQTLARSHNFAWSNSSLTFFHPKNLRSSSDLPRCSQPQKKTRKKERKRKRTWAATWVWNQTWVTTWVFWAIIKQLLTPRVVWWWPKTSKTRAITQFSLFHRQTTWWKTKLKL